MLCYNLPDYPGEMAGEGGWVDMYLDAAGSFPVGRLWVSAEQNSIGCEIFENCNDDHLTRVALQLREFNAAGVRVLNTFEFIKSQYYGGTINTGDLADARVKHETP
ncbi:hypothetical protein C5U48_05720 [Mycolicibacter virginiensis]|uniref:Uncharacterized protein n=2 Tax=Mycolicibacter virginiensis TaxID=1795032 RepID=A0A9X7IPK7_9MYCO|nr:hypothetical protein C5U48_05720 [Mycolicibacter virginiensis]